VDPYCYWCAHDFSANRARYLLLTNTHSFLSVAVPGSGLTSETAFIRASVNAIQRYRSMPADDLTALVSYLISLRSEPAEK